MYRGTDDGDNNDSKVGYGDDEIILRPVCGTVNVQAEESKVQYAYTR